MNNYHLNHNIQYGQMNPQIQKGWQKIENAKTIKRNNKNNIIDFIKCLILKNMLRIKKKDFVKK